MAKFNLNNKSSSKTLKEKAKFLEYKSDFDFRQIPFEDIKVNEKNFYNVKNLDDLTRSIEENGLMHNIEVLEVLDGEKKSFKILSGERRYQAIKRLREATGSPKYDYVPCKVIKGLDEIEEEIHLIKGNSDTRILSEEEKRLQIKRLNELYTLKGEHSKGDNGRKLIPKKEIAKELQMSQRTVERYTNVNEKLIPELQEFFDNKVISLTDADKFAKFDEEMQYSVLEILRNQNKISKEQIETIKEENQRLSEEKELKEKQLKEKEVLIEEYQKEGEEIKDALRDKEEEKKALLDKLKREIEEENKEEVERLEGALNALNTESRELAKKEKELSKNNKKLLKQIEELEKKSRLSDKEAIKIEVAKEKAKDITKSIKSQVDSLIDIINLNNLLEVRDEAEKEIENLLRTLKVKTGKK
ncbi:MAG: ParB N-terminal domain-containing protein [Clostridium sp.]